jgi:hypothetical protein
MRTRHPTHSPASTGTALPPFRPPAVPLVVHDPYFSTWSVTDSLAHEWPKHWTGYGRGMTGLIRVDGKAYRYLGLFPSEVPAAEQLEVLVTPTRSIYTFCAGPVALVLTFTTPALPQDLDLLSRPVTYVEFEVSSRDGIGHAVSVYIDASADWAVNIEEQVVWSRFVLADMQVMRIGSLDQGILRKSGDNLRIDWGYFYLAVPSAEAGRPVTVLTDFRSAREGFATSGRLPASDDLRMPRLASDQWPVMACVFDLGEIGRRRETRHVLLAYDELFAIEYLNRRLRPYWRRKGMEADQLLLAAESDFPALRERCAAFDQELMADLRRVCGERYARLCALAYRQCLAGHKLVADADGTPLYFSKENFSNGCIATVDVTYPSSPFFLLFNPDLLKAQLTPVLDYALSPRWNFPFAPHDLGVYPLANGQVYGGGERSEVDQMPVEECGNMLILLVALAETTGDTGYAKRYWGLVTQWADYLVDNGMNPGRQLCTDDFTGHLAHNTNLALKAIVGVGCYALLCASIGERGRAKRYRAVAEGMVRRWMEMADDGDHYRLVFDQSDTWSQKYNLVWDRLLGLDLFPPELARAEIAYYKTKQNQFGIPLDSRNAYTKLDWIAWSASLAEDEQDFRFLTDPLYDWAHQTPTRVPLSDWYWTTDGRQVGFQARSVVGGLFIKMLGKRAVWDKWLKRVDHHLDRTLAVAYPATPDAGVAPRRRARRR